MGIQGLIVSDVEYFSRKEGGKKYHQIHHLQKNIFSDATG